MFITIDNHAIIYENNQSQYALTSCGGKDDNLHQFEITILNTNKGTTISLSNNPSNTACLNCYSCK